MTVNPLAINFPPQISPMVDPETGSPTPTWWWVQQSLLNRTGGPAGVSTSDVEVIANEALTEATAAQAAANEALADAEAAQTTSNTALADAGTAQTTANSAQAAVIAETVRAEAAEALLAPKASPVFTGIATAPEYATTAGPTWTAGTGVPTSTQPQGSFYSRVGGAVGSTFYVSQGGGVWNAVAGV